MTRYVREAMLLPSSIGTMSSIGAVWLPLS